MYLEDYLEHMEFCPNSLFSESEKVILKFPISQKRFFESNPTFIIGKDFEIQIAQVGQVGNKKPSNNCHILFRNDRLGIFEAMTKGYGFIFHFKNKKDIRSELFNQLKKNIDVTKSCYKDYLKAINELEKCI